MIQSYFQINICGIVFLCGLHHEHSRDIEIFLGSEKYLCIKIKVIMNNIRS